jgi:hypothetical protein
MPVSNNYLSSREEKYEAISLNLLVCHNCTFLQLSESSDPKIHFNSTYPYYSGYSTTWKTHCASLASQLKTTFGLSPGDKVLEIASNDGTLLREFKNNGLQVLGIEPSINVANVAIQNGLRTIIDFFSYKLSRELIKHEDYPKLIIGCNVLAHVPDIRDFLKGVGNLMSAETIACFEFPHAAKMIKYNQFDTIYHEHYSYLNITSLTPILTEFELEIFKVEEHNLHGGSLRVYIKRKGSGFRLEESVNEVIRFEETYSPLNPKIRNDFNTSVNAISTSLVNYLRLLAKENKKVVIFGAAAKGTTLLNFAGINSSDVIFAVDSSKAKQGKYIPGTEILINAPEVLEKMDVDAVLILAWNFADEIIEIVKSICKKLPLVLIPIPELKVIEL